MPSHPDPQSVTSALLRDWPLPSPEGDKDDRGRTLVVGGARQTGGAVVLAGQAALRSGAGKLQVATIESLLSVMTLALPEALVRPLPEAADGALPADACDHVADLAGEASSVLVGPGLQDADQSAELTTRIIAATRAPLVLDALALAAITADPSCVRGHTAVLTPNRGELAHCLRTRRSDVEDDPCRHAVELAARTGCVVSVGGPTSYVATPDGHAWADATGGNGLAVSGSGDVQAGVVAGLLARGAAPAQAAVWATHVHGRAGERLASTVGRLGFLARELPGVIPAILLELGQ
jgi:ADP-dependent NAD(P)H-hydrate dehydratase